MRSVVRARNRNGANLDLRREHDLRRLLLALDGNDTAPHAPLGSWSKAVHAQRLELGVEQRAAGGAPRPTSGSVGRTASLDRRTAPGDTRGMRTNRTHALALAWIVVAIGCGDDSSGPSSAKTPGNGSGSRSGDPPDPTPPGSPALPPTNPSTGPAAGNPSGACAVPAEASGGRLDPTTVVGTGTNASCTGAAFVAAVAKGGVITFDCGPNPTTITLTATAKVYNDTGPKVIIDGGREGHPERRGQGPNPLPGHLRSESAYTGAALPGPGHAQLTVQNMTFVDGNSTGQKDEGGGGGAVFVRGGRFKVVNSRFFRNGCDSMGSDLGGGAIRVLDARRRDEPVVHRQAARSAAPGLGNACSNGGASAASAPHTPSSTASSRQPSRTAHPANARPAAATAAQSTTTATRTRSTLCGSTWKQHRQRRRRRDLLRQQQQNRHDGDPGLRSPQNPTVSSRPRLPGCSSSRRGYPR